MNGPLNIHPKVAGGSLAGLLSLVLLALLTRYTHHAVSAATEGEITLFVAAFGAWLSPIAKAEEQKVLGSSTS